MGSHSGRERILSKEVRSFMAEFLPLTRLIALSVGGWVCSQRSV